MYIYLYEATCVHRYNQRWRNTTFSFRESTEDRYWSEKESKREREKKLSLVVLCRLPI